MYTILKSISETNNFEFLYARSDYQNLYNEVEKKDRIHLFLDPVVTEHTFNDYGSVIEQTYSGAFMMLMSSDITKDATYDYKYETYIRPLMLGALSTLQSTIKCTGNYTFNSWRVVEVINLNDYGLDGIIVTYNISEDV